MIHSVSAVKYSPSFSQGVDLSRTGKYSSAPAVDTTLPNSQKEKSHVGKSIRNTIITVVIAVGALFGLYKGNIVKVNPEAKGFFNKIPHYLAKGGEWLNNKCYEPLARMCSSKKGKEVVEKVADEVTQTAAETVAK